MYRWVGIVAITEGCILSADMGWRGSWTQLLVKVSTSIVLSFISYIPACCFWLKVGKWNRNLIKIITMLRLKKRSLVKSVECRVHTWKWLVFLTHYWKIWCHHKHLMKQIGGHYGNKLNFTFLRVMNSLTIW